MNNYLTSYNFVIKNVIQTFLYNFRFLDETDVLSSIFSYSFLNNEKELGRNKSIYTILVSTIFDFVFYRYNSIINYRRDLEFSLNTIFKTFSNLQSYL